MIILVVLGLIGVAIFFTLNREAPRQPAEEEQPPVRQETKSRSQNRNRK
ncbi:MAG: hypothetical protein U5N58_00665 [Actinomycetota bacterium]|nr:hypothetical protein [Actinomycetota bacterium]